MAGSAAKTDRQSCPWELVVMRYFQTVVTARLGVAAAATFLALAAPASASTIDIEVDPSFDDDAAVYRAAPGEANQLTIGADPAGAFTFQDPGATAVASQAPCTSGGQPATFATCRQRHVRGDRGKPRRRRRHSVLRSLRPIHPADPQRRGQSASKSIRASTMTRRSIAPLPAKPTS